MDKVYSSLSQLSPRERWLFFIGFCVVIIILPIAVIQLYYWSQGGRLP